MRNLYYTWVSSPLLIGYLLIIDYLLQLDRIHIYKLYRARHESLETPPVRKAYGGTSSL